MKKISVSNQSLNNIKITLPILFVMAITSFFVNLGSVSENSHYMILFYTLVFCLFSTLLIANNFNKKQERIIVYSGFLLHVALVLFDYYVMYTPHHGTDVFGYYNHSKELFYGYETMDYGGLFSRFVAFFMRVFGANMYLSQFMNVIYWVIAVIVVKKILDELATEGFYSCIGLFLVSFAPNYLLVSTVLLRESLISLFIILSFYYFIKWSKNGKLLFAIASMFLTIPAIVMHSGSLVLIVVEMMFFCVYSPEKKKISIDKRTFLLMIMFALVFATLWLLPFTRKVLFLRFLKYSGLSLIDVVNSTLAREINNYNIYGAPSNADYLVYSYVNNYYELFTRTIKNMLLFWAYPLPGYIRNYKDLIAFLTDSSMYLIVFILMLLAVVLRKSDMYIMFGLTFSLIFDAIFAWGVTNGGTAMRHRVKIVNIIIILLVYSLKKIQKIQKKKI